MHYRRSTAMFVQFCRIASSSIVLFGALVASGCGGGGGGSSGPPPTYSIGGSITGLGASGLVLANGTDTVSPASGAGSFTFGAQQVSGASYAVSVQTHPAGQSCAVSGGSGSIGTANVMSVQVTCTTNILQGTIDGLVASGLVLANGSATVAPPVNATAFAFTMPLNHGDTYAVAVKTQPTGQSCQVSNGMGAAGAINKAIVVSCAGHQWTWLGGSNTANASGVYGTKNVAAATNTPGARAGSVTWADSQGALWLFGGYGNDGVGTDPTVGTSYLNDLWKYDPASGLWTWVSGSNAASQHGVYGTLGMAAPGNIPGGRNYAASWTDSQGNLWLFGGNGYSSTGTANSDLNDLWKYDLATKQWAWMGGANTGNANGVYGTPGITTAGKFPGAREGAASWVDPATGSLWLFGGYGYDSSVSGLRGDLNDLWKFDPTLMQWTWVAGLDTASASGNYGTKGISAPGNYPGARQFAAAWADSGRFWLFGGNGYPKMGTNTSLDDLWQYNLVTGEWTWMSGSDVANVFGGVYGMPGIPSVTNNPGARSQSVGWRDSQGAIWLFSGYGYDSNGALGSLNDLWKYDPIAGWTWVKGEKIRNSPGQYGSLGLGGAPNTPGARQLASAWVNANGTLWLFGGYGYDSLGASLRYMNDLWFIVPQ